MERAGAYDNQGTKVNRRLTMKRITTTLVAAAVAIIGMAMAGAEPPTDEQREQQNPADFLQKLVGEWSAVVHAVQDPAQDPYRFEGKETSRMLGGQWLVSEFYSEVEGQTIHSILTIGYDPTIEKFVATYANSLQTSLWTYNGTLNDEGTTLTLKTKGPFMGDPDQKADYRVVIERKDEDEWTMSSQIHIPDEDEWVEFLSFKYERKK
ncbi:MAG: DUF1579 domain-containing protein [Phycisphaerales bacterium]|nr:MAG: DUF1579 domain-containing protein [Phycisphaerales bacterium]